MKLISFDASLSKATFSPGPTSDEDSHGASRGSHMHVGISHVGTQEKPRENE